MNDEGKLFTLSAQHPLIAHILLFRIILSLKLKTYNNDNYMGLK